MHVTNESRRWIVLSCPIVFALASLLLLPLADVQADSGFDGTWVGTETATAAGRIDSDEQKFVPSPHRITIIIGRGGTMLGIVGGICPGRYEHVQRAGNTLSFGAKNCFLKVSLSKDGKTLTEQGFCMNVTKWADTAYYGRAPNHLLQLGINATLHRR
jgi:hypothetical protein